MRLQPADRETESALDLPQPIFDTPGAEAVKRRPESVLAEYRRRAGEVWLSVPVQRLAERLAEALAAKRGPVWATLVGPFGFGKSATAAALWRQLDDGQRLAIPPISATSVGALLEGVAGLLQSAAGERRTLVESAYVQALDGKGMQGAKRQPIDVLVDLLRRLCGPGGPFEEGVVLCIDEAQQFLGPLDPSALQALRSLVWALRTERVNCVVLLTLDPLLHRRLDRWASDILHRIADRGEVLDLRTAYDASFVTWLWQRWGADRTGGRILDQDLAIALGQYVEREDLANGPRTLVEVFHRIIAHPAESYGVPEFVWDLRSARFRFFSGPLNAQTLVSALLEDAWVNEVPERRGFIELLAGFPNGIPAATLGRLMPEAETHTRLRRELFTPLLVNAAQGPALEALQRVRRQTWQMDELVLRCWETLPALESLSAHAPRLVSATLVDWWFGPHPEACGRWRRLAQQDPCATLFEGESDPDGADRRSAAGVRALCEIPRSGAHPPDPSARRVGGPEGPPGRRAAPGDLAAPSRSLLP